MDLDRGALANIDRRLLAEFDREEWYQMVRIPVSPAKWSTWKRYCATAGISMGRAIVALMDRELASVAETSSDDSPVLAQRAREQLEHREADVAGRERAVAAADERMRGRSERLRRWEAELQTEAQQVELASRLAAQRRDPTPKVGRNDRCPCGSGLKYKHCHGLPGRT
ncbi:hypothetical protein BMS3Bbin01_02024 [bacterium BMS3Bbin01]|nr:hypothetical protein BMS3Bbin01_02024 [bacterium BMS3Bbin01]